MEGILVILGLAVLALNVWLLYKYINLCDDVEHTVDLLAAIKRDIEKLVEDKQKQG